MDASPELPLTQLVMLSMKPASLFLVLVVILIVCLSASNAVSTSADWNVIMAFRKLINAYPRLQYMVVSLFGMIRSSASLIREFRNKSRAYRTLAISSLRQSFFSTDESELEAEPEDDTLRLVNEDPRRLIALKVLGRREGIDFELAPIGNPFPFSNNVSVAERF